MKHYDAAVIGGGLLGCFAARELMRYELSAVLIEGREDVCTGISRANTAIVYPGYDHKPGTTKQSLTLRANAVFDRLCRELDVPFTRCGSLMVSFGENADRVLRKKLANGLACGVPGLRLIGGDEARELESSLADGVRSALYAPTAGTTNPWQLCYAAFENAGANGCDTLLNTKLLSIRRADGGYILETTGGEIFSSAVINCAGLSADRVHEMLFAPSVRIIPQGADYMLLRRGSAKLTHIIQHEAETGKGITAVPTVGGSILLGPTERDSENELSAVSAEGLAQIRALSCEVLPGLKAGEVIRSFAAARPIIRSVTVKNGEVVPDGRSIGSFAIENPEPGFISFIGIKTPGLTCSRELGAMAAERTAAHLGAKQREDFDPVRKAIPRVRELDFDRRRALVESDPDYGEVLCLCEDISRAEVREAIRRGAVTLDGVKRRCGAMLGVCQGSRCQQKITQLLARELGIPEDSVTKSGGASRITGGRHG